MNPGSSTSSRAFKITLHRNGTASYHGEANVKLKGKYRGSISEEDFLHLASYIEERNFFELKTLFPGARGATVTFSGEASLAIAAPTVMTTVVRRSKKTTLERALGVKINNPDPPPKQLLEIENEITSIAMKIKWEKM